ncbi:MAG: hypothetical protein AB8B85_04105 [Paracoccaceae bacterium]
MLKDKFLISVGLLSLLVFLLGSAWSASAASRSADGRMIYVSAKGGEDEEVRQLLIDVGRTNAVSMIYAAECGFSDGSYLIEMEAVLSGERAFDSGAGVYYVRLGWDIGSGEVWAADLECHEGLLAAFQAEAFDHLNQAEILMAALPVNEDA